MLEAMGGAWVWTVLLLPVLVGVFKSEIGKIITSWRIYRSRPFDTDRDTDTPEICMLGNPATGGSSYCVILDYIFWAKSVNRGVDVAIISPDFTGMTKRHFTFADWGGAVKTQIPEGIDSKCFDVLNENQVNV